MEKIKDKKNVNCQYCNEMIGFFEKGVLLINSRKTCYTRITESSHTVKCRKCSNLTHLDLKDNQLLVKNDYKLRSKLIIKQKELNKLNNI